MKVLCENYENCGVDFIENCPHKIPHDKDDLCDYPCNFETQISICREIILKGNEWKVLVIGYPTIARLIHGQTVDFESHKVCLIPDDQLVNEHQKIINSEKKKP